MAKKKITVWERWSHDHEDYRHNHIEDGWIGDSTGSTHDDGSAPIGTEQQTANWAKGRWWNTHSYLINGVVTEIWRN